MTKTYVFDSRHLHVDCKSEDQGRAFIVEIGPDMVDPEGALPFWVKLQAYQEDEDDESVSHLSELYLKGFKVTVELLE